MKKKKNPGGGQHHDIKKITKKIAWQEQKKYRKIQLKIVDRKNKKNMCYRYYPDCMFFSKIASKNT